MALVKDDKRQPRLPGRVLLVGPLPPPFGGARVSFKLLVDELTKLGSPEISLVDVPIRKATAEDANNAVEHQKTLIAVLRSIGAFREVDAVWIFCSAGFSMSYALIYLIGCRLAGIPVALRLFGGHPYARIRRLWTPIRKVVESILKISHVIIVQTQAGLREFPVSIQERTRVIHGYREFPEIFANGSENGKHDGIVKFYYAGSISKEKGSFLLVDAFNSARKILAKLGVRIELHLFGADLDDIKEYIGGSEYIHFHGMVRNDALLCTLGRFDALIFPSLYENEGHSGTIIEAMMAGKPVICFDRPGPSELIKDDVNGVVVPCGSEDQLVSAIVRLAKEPQTRRRLSLQAREDAQSFDVRIAVPRMLSLLAGELIQ